jgi:chemotaxis signal transduction protein
MRYVLFDVDSQTYALRADTIREISIYENIIHNQLYRQSFMEGLLNKRGKIIPVVDMKRVFSSNSTNQNSMVIIMNDDNGLAVDAVITIAEIEDLGKCDISSLFGSYKKYDEKTILELDYDGLKEFLNSNSSVSDINISL